jgi:hypothetical protein
MNILDEEEFHQEILVTPIFNIHASPRVFPACNFCQNLGLVHNCPYWSSKFLRAHPILIDHRPYLVFVPV